VGEPQLGLEALALGHLGAQVLVRIAQRARALGHLRLEPVAVLLGEALPGHLGGEAEVGEREQRNQPAPIATTNTAYATVPAWLRIAAVPASTAIADPTA
jgi:hypothetical protein